MEKSNSNGMIILVLSLLFIVLVLCSYIIYDKELSTNSNQTSDTTNNSESVNSMPNQLIDITNNSENTNNTQNQSTEATTKSDNTNETKIQTTSHISKELFSYKIDDNLRTEFKIYQIDGVFVASFRSKAMQCEDSKALIFNSDGEKLMEFMYAYVDIDGDIINISYREDDGCSSSLENVHDVKYQVVNSNIIEKN